MARNLYWLICLAIISVFLLLGCNTQPEETLEIETRSFAPYSNSLINQPEQSPTSRRSPTVTISPTQTNSPSPKPTESPTLNLTPADTLTQSITPTPTIDFPGITVNVANAHCRYGPGKAYLHAADLFEGDHGLVLNRNYASTWLWVRFDKINYACWVAASLLDIEGDVSTISTYFPALPKSPLYNPPEKVTATRSGDQVIVTWEEVWMTEDDYRGYLIEANICQNGYMIDVAVHAEKPSYTFLDEQNCDGQSKGRLYAVEKHGYTDSVPIPWP